MCISIVVSLGYTQVGKLLPDLINLCKYSILIQIDKSNIDEFVKELVRRRKVKGIVIMVDKKDAEYINNVVSKYLNGIIYIIAD